MTNATTARLTTVAGRVEANSTLTINGHTIPVPEKTNDGWIFAPIRIGTAMQSLGYRFAYPKALSQGRKAPDGTWFEFDVIPLAAIASQEK